jgi:hypothetical protein
MDVLYLMMALTHGIRKKVIGNKYNWKFVKWMFLKKELL